MISTPGQDLEKYLNSHYGPGNPYYEDFCKYVRQGIERSEGWCANIEIDGRKYRRSRVSLPKHETRYFSITTVFMDSQEEYKGQYHQHPYGEINCVIQLDDTAELKGMSGWQGAGWTSPGAGTHHYPEVLASVEILPDLADNRFRCVEEHWSLSSSSLQAELVTSQRQTCPNLRVSSRFANLLYHSDSISFQYKFRQYSSTLKSEAHQL